MLEGPQGLGKRPLPTFLESNRSVWIISNLLTQHSPASGPEPRFPSLHLPNSDILPLSWLDRVASDTAGTACVVVEEGERREAGPPLRTQAVNCKTL